MTICKITVFALVRELQELKRYRIRDTLSELYEVWEEVEDEEGEYIRAEDFLAVMARNVIPEGSTP